MNFYPHHIGDFNNATRHLTRVERSLYRDLIELYYDTEQPLPADDYDRLARRVIAVTEEEKSALQYVLDEFFTLEDGVYKHERCDIEIEKYRNVSSAKARAGKASAEARKKKAAPKKKKATSDSEHNLTGVEQVLNVCATNQEPRTKNQEPINKDICAAKAGTNQSDCREVFEHWQQEMNHPKSKLDQKRTGLIKKAIKLGYSIEDLKSCITGYTHSAFHMGQNENGTRFDGLDLILRDASKIDFGLQQLQTANKPGTKPNGYQQTNSNHNAGNHGRIENNTERAMRIAREAAERIESAGSTSH
ncbi:YdaU family protein [Rheinheimera sp. MMS21-TC3]|uniref:YdaU family protein n=1 Tax=Rheinheimera sp. MMS21-TC3 TaxID=3072790 RepID=UPI0028C3B690|nr:YdaU family protein [Rheinheimera sp. MMS21-TC3]WNO60423.1 YdaU family protein [Rheinheimera sp. MMS21-TC3]